MNSDPSPAQMGTPTISTDAVIGSQILIVDDVAANLPVIFLTALDNSRDEERGLSFFGDPLVFPANERS